MFGNTPIGTSAASAGLKPQPGVIQIYVNDFDAYASVRGERDGA